MCLGSISSTYPKDHYIIFKMPILSGSRNTFSCLSAAPHHLFLSRTVPLQLVPNSVVKSTDRDTSQYCNFKNVHIPGNISLLIRAVQIIECDDYSKTASYEISRSVSAMYRLRLWMQYCVACQWSTALCSKCHSTWNLDTGLCLLHRSMLWFECKQRTLVARLI